MKHYLLLHFHNGRFKAMNIPPLIAPDAINWLKSYRADNPDRKYRLEYLEVKDDY